MDGKKVETAILRLKKALSLCSGQSKRNLENSIEDAIVRAKKLKFFILKDEYEYQAKKVYDEIHVL